MNIDTTTVTATTSTTRTMTRTTTTTTTSPTTTTMTTTTTRTTEAASQSSLAVEKVEKIKRVESEQTTERNSSVQDNREPLMEKEKVEEMPVIMKVKKPSAGLSTSIIMPDDILVMNVTVKTNVAVGHIQGVTINPINKSIPPDIEAIINITNRRKGEDYEYDYSDPTLPPSLPNVR
jgi:hypothetical protein